MQPSSKYVLSLDFMSMHCLPSLGGNGELQNVLTFDVRAYLSFLH
jgi:hypothetical protein